MMEKGTIYRELVELVIKEREQHMVDQYPKENYCDFTDHAEGSGGIEIPCGCNSFFPFTIS
jgi:hypothetical protein